MSAGDKICPIECKILAKWSQSNCSCSLTLECTSRTQLSFGVRSLSWTAPVARLTKRKKNPTGQKKDISNVLPRATHAYSTGPLKYFLFSQHIENFLRIFDIEFIIWIVEREGNCNNGFLSWKKNNTFISLTCIIEPFRTQDEEACNILTACRNFHVHCAASFNL